MNKRRISELTTEELKKVFDKNYKLQYEVSDDYQESEMDYVSEILDCFRSNLIDYSVGFGSRNHIHIRNDRGFIEGVLKAQSGYGFLNDEYTPVIEEILSKFEIFYNMDYDNLNHEKLESWLEDQVEIIRSKVTSQFDAMTDYNNGDIESYFVEFYSDNRMDDNTHYIDENYVLYEDVAYTKSYA